MSLQEEFWQKEYGPAYLAANSEFDEESGRKGWRKMLQNAEGITSFLECGCNRGRNLGFLREVLPEASQSAIEIYPPAFEIASRQNTLVQAFNGAILDSEFEANSFDLVFTCGVLIHIHPDQLLETMRRMTRYASKYVLFAEYFHRTPVSIEYKGRMDTLFKRDFGRFYLEHWPQAKVVDYGFLWGHLYDAAGFDDVTYWLFDVSDCNE